MNGYADAAAVDHYKISLSEGQRVIIREAESIDSRMDGTISIANSSGHEHTEIDTTDGTLFSTSLRPRMTLPSRVTISLTREELITPTDLSPPMRHTLTSSTLQPEFQAHRQNSRSMAVICRGAAPVRGSD